MNVELTEVTRRFGRTQAVAGVTLQTGPGVFGPVSYTHLTLPTTERV